VEIDKISARMKGTTVEIAVKQFKSMKPKFDSIYQDINKYGEFLNNAAQSYEAAENDGTNRAGEQGKIF